MDPLSIAAVGWLMSALVSKAVTALLEAWAKRIGLGNEFKTLKRQLLQLGALLTSARGLRTDNIFLEELVQDLQQQAYQAENLLDELDYYRLEDGIQQGGTQEKVIYNNKSSVASSSSGFWLASHSILSYFKRMSCRSATDALVPLSKTFSSRINLSRRMNELSEQLQKSEEIVRKAVKTGSLVKTVQNIEISQTKATNIPQTSSFLTEPRVVFGRDQECDKLMDLLTNEETAIVDKVPVLAIVGGGGVGKTTLAQLVFNDPKVQSYFEVRLWICVSSRFDCIRLTREMLEGTFGKRYDELSNLNELQNKLMYGLESKRFLLVLDDMWEDENKMQWDSIIAPLNYCCVKGSTILVTTRNQSVAKMVDAKDIIYLQGLDEDAFLSFFSMCIFNDSNFRGNWRLRNIGQQIANMLKGNPLAAKTVSVLLKEKLDERYWIKIRDSEEWKSQKGPNDIMPALWLSYEHMPFHLQRCFSHCAIFPEDHPFTCDQLVYLWMAQGFLDGRSQGKRMEDIGIACFNDLFNRGFFQPIQSTVDDEVYYTFHDLLHNLARLVSFNEILRINDIEPRQIPPTICHLSIFNSTERGEEVIIREFARLEGDNLRSINIWDELPSGTLQIILSLLNKTKFLRTVSLTQCSEVQAHNLNFQNFVSLRYLRLFVPRSWKTLPREIGRLYHLEVFEIGCGCTLNDLPNNFSDLISLRHFIVEKFDLHSKIKDVGKLKSLQELKHFNVKENNGFEIKQLGSLKEIGGSLNILNLENVISKTEASKARLAEKERLDVLSLQWLHGAQENESVLEALKPNTNLKWLNIKGYGGVASPTWLDPSLIFLESLILVGCKAWEVLPPIGELEFLRHLQLSRLATTEIGPQCYGTHQSRKFPSLEEFEIIGMADLEKWVWHDHLWLKKLKKLTIKRCNKLVDLPLLGCSTFDLLERFPSLECLKISCCPLIYKLSSLPYSYVLSDVSIMDTGFIISMRYIEKSQSLSLTLDESSSLVVGELLAFHMLSSLRVLEIYNITNLESLDLHSFVALENLVIKGCHSLTTLIFGEHLVSLKTLSIISCEILSSLKGLKSWVNLERMHVHRCFGFIAAWDSASKEIERTDPDFSLSLTRIEGDSLGPLTLPICKQLTSLQIIELEFSSFIEEEEICPQLLTTINLVDIRGCKTLQSLPFGLFPSLKDLWIGFPRIKSLSTNNCKSLQSLPFGLFPSLKDLWIRFPLIKSLSTNSRTEITEECLKLRNIQEIRIIGGDFLYNVPVGIHLILSSEEMVCQ